MTRTSLHEDQNHQSRPNIFKQLEIIKVYKQKKIIQGTIIKK